VKLEESQEKAHFGILHAFSEMDVACFTDTSSATLPFKEDVLFVLDYIAKKTRSQTLAVSFNVDEEFLYQKDFVKIGSLQQYSDWVALFRDMIVDPDIPVRVYGEHPLEQRIHIGSNIARLLNSINGESEYIVLHGLGNISIQWRGGSIDKHLDIYPVETGYQVLSGHGIIGPRIDIPTDEELFSFVSKYASNELTKNWT
jgi:hypothetical protein